MVRRYSTLNLFLYCSNSYESIRMHPHEHIAASFLPLNTPLCLSLPLANARTLMHTFHFINLQMLQGMSLPPWFLGDALPLLHIDDHHNNNQGQIQYNPHSQFEANDMGPGIGIGNQFFPPMMNEQLPSNQYYPYHDIGQMVPLMNYGGQIGIIGDVSAGEGIPPNILHPELMVGPGRHGSILDPGQISDKNMKLDLQIPSDLGCVSFLMGSKGVKLREIEAASACVVTVPRLPQKVNTEVRKSFLKF